MGGGVDDGDGEVDLGAFVAELAHKRIGDDEFVAEVAVGVGFAGDLEDGRDLLAAQEAFDAHFAAGHRFAEEVVGRHRAASNVAGQVEGAVGDEVDFEAGQVVGLHLDTAAAGDGS